MNPIDLIKEDHRKVEDLFLMYDRLDPLAYDERRMLVDQILEELEFHADMEETLLYPRLRDAAGEEDEAKVEEAFAEHEIAANLIDDLKALAPEDAEFDAKVKVLKETVTRHVQEEEEELLPLAEEILGPEDLATMGKEITSFRDALEEVHSDMDEEF